MLGIGIALRLFWKANTCGLYLAYFDGYCHLKKSLPIFFKECAVLSLIAESGFMFTVN